MGVRRKGANIGWRLKPRLDGVLPAAAKPACAGFHSCLPAEEIRGTRGGTWRSAKSTRCASIARLQGGRLRNLRREPEQGRAQGRRLAHGEGDAEIDQEARHPLKAFHRDAHLHAL